MKPNFCSFCGCQLPIEQQNAKHPHCATCETTHWQNPRPVAVLLQPVRRKFDKRLGLVIGRRSIAPFIGEMALPAGYVEPGETVEAAAYRELWEEVRLQTQPETILVLETKPAGGTLLILCTTEFVLYDYTDTPFAPTEECSERAVMWEPGPLCFPIHTEWANEWFKGQQ